MGGCCSTVDAPAGQGDIEERSSDSARAVALLNGMSAVTSTVDVSISAKSLRNRDLLSKSDPMAVLYLSQGGTFTEVGRTEVINNTLDPQFVKLLRVSYNFERVQEMKLRFYDIDTAQHQDTTRINLSRNQDYLGEATFLLSQLLTSEGKVLNLPVRDHKGNTGGGVCRVAAEEVANQNASVTLTLQARNLDNKDTFSKSDPFVRISRAAESGTWIPVLRTEVKKNNLNPDWAAYQTTLVNLCNGDIERPLKLEVLDWDSNGAHDLIGETTSSVRQLQSSTATSAALDLVHPKKVGKPGYKSSGKLLVRELVITPRPSFLEYIAGGCELAFLVAIDFTASNRAPTDPSSLHYLAPDGRPTAYEQAISAVGRTIEFYDTDRSFGAWGFGGCQRGQPVSHCFALNGNAFQPEVQGVQGILQAYRRSLGEMQLSGPTLFAPVISAACAVAAQPTPHLRYHVLLILTDGVIMDMPNTLKQLVEAADLPLSLLIVGVGNEDFSNMEALDGDKKRISYQGKPAWRDLVQFVPFREMQSPDMLAEHLLAEIPDQLTTYFRTKNIPPPVPAARAPVTPTAPPAAAGQAQPSAPPIMG